MKERAIDAGAVALMKAIVSLAVLAFGFRAVSDDDYARVVIAEQWVKDARFDASGTSWLPLPFWITGGAMKAFGRELVVARVVSVVLGAASIALVYVASRWLGASRRGAIFGAVVASVFAWSAWLGAAMVPELPTAALVLFATAAIAAREAPIDRRVLGAAAIFAATLARYEAWPIAVAFAAISIVDAVRSKRLAWSAPSLLAILGVLLWIATNRREHGDAFHFFARVSAYKRALGGAEESFLAGLFGYPVALLREAPELVVLVVAAIGTARARAPALARHRRPLAIAAFTVFFLALARLKDGAPTHHPERALLFVFLLFAVLAGDLLADSKRGGAVIAASVAIVAGVVVHRASPHEPFADRADEIAIGADARARLGEDAKVLVEVADYGYLATIAAFGRPERAILDRSIDPREPRVPSSFDDATSVVFRVQATHANAVVGRRSSPAAIALGLPISARGAWALWIPKLDAPVETASAR